MAKFLPLLQSSDPNCQHLALLVIHRAIGCAAALRSVGLSPLSSNFASLGIVILDQQDKSNGDSLVPFEQQKTQLWQSRSAG